MVTVRRRRLQLALGVLWLLDAALQFQPFMFGRHFATDVIAPTAQGNPGWVAQPVVWAAHLIAAHPVPWNAAFAVVQLVLALGLFRRSTVRPALAASIVWSLFVWWLGEGMGGLLVGPDSPLTGMPGAVLLYAVAAVLLWPTDPPQAAESVAASSPLRRPGSALVWLLLWGGAAVELVLPANRTALRSTIAGMTDGEPGWVAAMDRTIASALGGVGVDVALALVGVLALVALVPLAPAWYARPALVVGMVFGLAVWVLVQNFGELFTGEATDPNSAPLLVLLCAAYWPFGTRGRRPSPYPVTAAARRLSTSHR